MTEETALKDSVRGFRRVVPARQCRGVSAQNAKREAGRIGNYDLRPGCTSPPNDRALPLMIWRISQFSLKR